MEDLEQELREALTRQPAPFSLKRRVMERRRAQRPRSYTIFWQRLAACFLLAVVVGGAAAWHQREERRKGEAAREQVMTALRITNRALNQVRTQLAEHDRDRQE